MRCLLPPAVGVGGRQREDSAVGAEAVENKLAGGCSPLADAFPALHVTVDEGGGLRLRLGGLYEQRGQAG